MGRIWVAMMAGMLLSAEGLRAAGFPNETQVPGTLLSGVNGDRQGRTAIIAYHNGILYTIPEGPSRWAPASACATAISP